MPAWLPPLMPVGGNWNDLVASLHDVFERDFTQGKPRVAAEPVWWDRRILPGEQFEEGFWHLITKEDPEYGRLPDFRRAERLAWCAAILANWNDPAVTSWEYMEGNNQRRRYLWVRDHDYVVVLQPRRVGGKNILILITAYHIDGESGRRSLRRKFDKRVP